MLDCISVENMRLSDRKTIESFTPSLTLMYRAAMGVFLAAEWRGDIAIVVGSGNNGGDGFALACILKERGFDCRVVTFSGKLSPDSAFYAEKAKQLGVRIRPFASGCFEGADVIVDCLLGTGFSGSIREPYAAAINEMNASGAYVVSVDIPSGMNGDTGEADLAVLSDLTVTIGFVKIGMLAPSAGEYMKRLVCADIGIVLDREEYKICSDDEWNENYARLDIFRRCPPYLNMRPINVRGVKY